MGGRRIGATARHFTGVCTRSQAAAGPNEIERKVTITNARRALPAVADDALQYECDVGGPFAEAAHEIGIPLLAERHVDAHAIAFLHERRLQIAPDAVKHLELEAI